MLPLWHSTTRVQITSVEDTPEVSLAFTHPTPRWMLPLKKVAQAPVASAAEAQE